MNKNNNPTSTISNNSSQEICILLKNNRLYKKYIMYFAFKYDTNKKFNIYFLDSIDNCTNLEKQKTNPQIMYKETEIQVPITYTSGLYGIQGQNPLNQPAQTIKPLFNPKGARVSVSFQNIHLLIHF